MFPKFSEVSDVDQDNLVLIVLNSLISPFSYISKIFLCIMSLVLWKNVYALKEPLVFNLMEAHLTVMLFISYLTKKNPSLPGTKISQDNGKAASVFPLVAELIFSCNWMLTPLIL